MFRKINLLNIRLRGICDALALCDVLSAIGIKKSVVCLRKR